LAVCRSAPGLTLNLTFDSSVTSLANASNIETATQYAAQQIENLITDSITVNITVSAQNTTAFLGESQPFLYSQSYSTIRSDLLTHDMTPIDALAVASLPATDPTGSNNFRVPTAEERVLGILPANGPGPDGSFIFSSNSAYTFDLNPSNRAVSGEFDFVGIAEHELTHELGRIALVGYTGYNGHPAYSPLDLFRYSAAGTRSLSSADPTPYFSVDGGQTDLKGFSNASDLGDWATSGPDSFNAFTNAGAENDLTPVDLAELDAMGYTPSYTARNLTWDGSTNSINSSHWINSSNTLTLYTTYIGASLSISTGGEVIYAPSNAISDPANMALSSTSIQGTSLTISQGSFLLDDSMGASGRAYYLTLDNGGTLNVSGTTTYGSNNAPILSQSNLTLDGGLIIGNTFGSTATATFSGGITKVGLTGASNVPPDPAIDVGDSGSGALTQSGTAYIGAGVLNVAAQPGSSGAYTMNGGVLNVAGAIYLGGTSDGSGGITPGGTAAFKVSSSGSPVVTTARLLTAGSGTFTMSGGSFTVFNSLSVSPGFIFTVSGGTFTAGSTINASTITQTGGTTNLGPVAGTGSLSVGNISGASASMTAEGLNQTSLTINSTGSFTLGGGVANVVNSLIVNGNGKLDLTNHHLFIDYGSGQDPIASVAAWIINGYAGGAWNGPGIISSNAQSNSGSYGIGYADSSDLGNPAGLAPGQIEVMYTLLGDANLDGMVNGTDLAILASNFNRAVSGWDAGDFNYDGAANGADFADLASNFNKGSSQSDVAALDSFVAVNGLLADVPEPATALIMIASASTLIARRRHNLP